MNVSTFTRYGVFLLLLITAMAGPAGGEEMDAKTQEMMAKWQAYASPSAKHKILDALVGQWNHSGKWWMDPNGPPETFAGTSEIKWILGGRFLQHTAQGPGEKGHPPFEGMGYTGFDNSSEKYQTMWIDNMGTGMMRGEGTYDAAKKELNERGTFSNHVVASSDYRGVFRFIDDDHYKYEFYSSGPDGKEFLSMSIDYKRKK